MQKKSSNMNIVDIAAASDDFDLLVRALDTAGLTNTIRMSTDITVFAPTDAAFTQLAQTLGYMGDTSDEDAVFASLVSSLTILGGGDPIPLLTNVLLYHVSAGEKTAAEIDQLDAVTTLLQGATFEAAGNILVDNEPDVANPTIVIPDIPASNGTIQAIDNVLIPIDIPGNEGPTPTDSLTDIVAASGGVFDNNGDDFDILLNAVLAADLAGALDDPNADLTVFAPTDAAFLGLAQNLGFSGSDEGDAFAYIVEALTLLSGGKDPIPLLTDILLYHVAPESLSSDEVITAETIDTLLGATLGVDGLSLVDNEPDLTNPGLIDTDLKATNGIAHVIDGVLIPLDILSGDGGPGQVDFLIGDGADEEFQTGRNTDFVSGLGGDDKILLGQGNDVGLGGDGNDLLEGRLGKDTLHGGDGEDTVLGGQGSDEISGGAGVDLLNGGLGNDSISGGGGRDNILGQRGADDLSGGQGRDILSGGKGKDILNGGRGNDDLDGGIGHDTLIGGRGADTIDGGNGDDLIIGGRGADVLTGGGGADTFRFTPSHASDVVTDFDVGKDLIDIRLDGFDEFDDIAGRITDSADGAVLDLGEKTVTLEGVAAADLTESDFIFG